MARTISQIYNEIITEKQTFTSLTDLVPNPDTAQTFLSDLSSASKVAIWRLFCWLIAFAIWTHEQIFVEHQSQIEERAQEIIPGTVRWYKNISLLWQYGYSLTWDGDKYVYTDTTSVAAVASKIVTQAAAVEVMNQVQIKVAKGTVGSLAKLSTTEKSAFDTYIDKMKFGGVDVLKISADPDYLKISYTIEYDPLVLSATGYLLSDSSTYPVEDAINDYIQSLPFNADLKIINLTDAIQAAEGVVNAVCTVAQGSSNGGGAYTNILTTSTQTYASYAGYMIIDPGFPLPTYLTYTPAP